MGLSFLVESGDLVASPPPNIHNAFGVLQDLSEDQEHKLTVYKPVHQTNILTNIQTELHQTSQVDDEDDGWSISTHKRRKMTEEEEPTVRHALKEEEQEEPEETPLESDHPQQTSWLPQEIWEHILSMISLKGLFIAQQVCTLWRRVSKKLTSEDDALMSTISASGATDPIHSRRYIACCLGVLDDAATRKKKFTETVELQVVMREFSPLRDKRFRGAVVLPFAVHPNMKICLLGSSTCSCIHIEQETTLERRAN